MGAYRTAVLADSPVSYYDLDESGGVTAADAVGAANGTYSGTGVTYSQPGQSGQCVSLDGASGQVTAALRLSGVTGQALEAWFRSDDVTRTEQTVVKNGTSANGYGLVVSGNATTAGHLWVLYDGRAWMDTGHLLASGAWYHAVLVIDGSGHPVVYLNGAQVFTSTLFTPIAPTTQSTVGGEGGRFFKGRVDGAAYYNSTPGLASFQAHYAQAEGYARGAADFPPRPPGRLRPSPASQLARGLVLSWPGGQQDGNQPVNECNGTRSADSQALTPGTLGYGVGPYGRTYFTSSHGGPYFTFAHAPADQQSCTLEWWGAFRSWQTATPYISALWTNRNNVGGGLTLRLGDVGVPWDALEVGSLAARLTLGPPHHLVYVSAPAGVTLYADGREADAATAASSFSFTSSAIFRDDSVSARTPDGGLEQLNLWARPLSAAEVRERWRDPWGLYAGSSPAPALLAPFAPAPNAPILLAHL